MRLPQPRRRPARSLALTGAALLLAAAPAALLAPGAVRPGRARDAPPPDPLALIADITLIDARCPGIAADFGALFAYAQANGIDPLSIMPLGQARKSFDDAIERRAASTSNQDLCTAVAEQDAETAPGTIKQK